MDGLGIVGGLSILGTTGIVVPFSCAAWIHSIHRGIDVARASGLDHLAGATGSTSEKAVQQLHHLPEQALIDMGDFVGGMLKYLRRHPVPEGHRRRRLRQDDQARPGPARSSFAFGQRRSRLARRAAAGGRARRRSGRGESATANTRVVRPAGSEQARHPDRRPRRARRLEDRGRGARRHRHRARHGGVRSRRASRSALMPCP